jgi:hypothetical protein
MIDNKGWHTHNMLPDTTLHVTIYLVLSLSHASYYIQNQASIERERERQSAILLVR